MNGLEVTRHIREFRQNSPKIIALTAYAFPNVREKCLEAGMDDCIIKPVELRALAAVLKRHQA